MCVLEQINPPLDACSRVLVALLDWFTWVNGRDPRCEQMAGQRAAGWAANVVRGREDGPIQRIDTQTEIGICWVRWFQITNSSATKHKNWHLSQFQYRGWFGIEPNSIPRLPICTSKRSLSNDRVLIAETLVASPLSTNCSACEPELNQKECTRKRSHLQGRDLALQIPLYTPPRP